MARQTQQRIVIAGTSGSGKTTLARAVSDKLGLPYTEIDSLFHGEGWTPRVSFLDDIRAIAAGERWVSEWQYELARPILAARATTMVWLDYRWPVQMARVIRRTALRKVRCEELWNGNREGSLLSVLTDDEHVIRWAWRTRLTLRDLPERLVADHPRVDLVRLRSQLETDRWLNTLTRG